MFIGTAFCLIANFFVGNLLKTDQFWLGKFS